MVLAPASYTTTLHLYDPLIFRRKEPRREPPSKNPHHKPRSRWPLSPLRRPPPPLQTSISCGASTVMWWELRECCTHFCGRHL